MPRIKAKDQIEKQKRLNFFNFLNDHNIDTPEAEYRFHEKRKWLFDYAWPSRKIALEIEGGIYGHGKKCRVCGRKAPGAHSSVIGIMRDIEKYNNAQVLGWKVIRVMPSELMTIKAIALIKSVFNEPLREPSDIINLPISWENLFEIECAVRHQREILESDSLNNLDESHKSLSKIRAGILAEQERRINLLLKGNKA